MARRLNELSPRFLPLAEKLIARCVEANIQVLIVCTGRTDEEQAAAIAAGTSKVVRSKHQSGDAIDLVPYKIYDLYGPDKVEWDTRSPAAAAVWKRMGQIGEDLGLRWGGRFTPLNAQGLGWDPGHFEYPTTPPASGQLT